MTLSKVMIGMLLTAALAGCESAGACTATASSIGGQTASSEQALEGIVAADRAVLPLGTKIAVREAGEYSGIYTVLDSGPGIDGGEVDIFIGARANAKEFGRQKVRVRIVQRHGEETAEER